MRRTGYNAAVMPSPFPGMDPYLEPHWLDVHTKLIAYAADELNRVLPENLVARTEERIAVKSGENGTRSVGPDVRVFAAASAGVTAPASGAAVVVEAPFTLVLEADPVTERFIRIVDRDGRLVTVVEFISPGNKRGDGLETYREKRGDLLSAGVNFVEVDLVRQGDWRGLLRPHVCPPEALSTYRATVRTPPGTVAYLFPIPLDRPIPDVPVPLRPGDAKVMLPLQRLVQQVYANGRYGQTIDYRRPCEPPLQGGEAERAERLLRDAGRA